MGDECVRLCLELIAAQPERLAEDALRVQLFSAFHAVCSALDRAAEASDAATTHAQRLEQGLATLAPLERRVLLLAVVESFSYEEIGRILGLEIETVRAQLARARQGLKQKVSLPVLIIEDEAPIAMELRHLVQEMGLTVAHVVAREAEAVRSAEGGKLGLVLADIQLQDDGSGLAAAQAILEKYDVPIVFVTGFPERLLSGTGMEPAFVVGKPFCPDGLKAMIAQALATYATHARAKEHKAGLLAKLRQLNGSTMPMTGRPD